MVVFCAYCGKSFTRKEHLERHIPSHTNVKPYRCSACQLSFARRDLLQRHHSTYHEARDPMEPLPGGVPTVAGRTPIACQNCASAKTGCDKRVPCSRCAEKKLPCAARFARRSSKAAMRAAQSTTLGAPQPSITAVVSPSMMDVDQKLSRANSPGKTPTAGQVITVITTMDPRLQQSPQQKTTPEHSYFSPGEYPSPNTKLEGLNNDFLHLNNDFIAQDAGYQDLLVWPEYNNIELDMYSNPMNMSPGDMSMPNFPELSDISSNSELITPSSASESVHTRGTSIVSTGDFDILKRVNMTRPSSNDHAIAEFEVVIASENSWPLARCNPRAFSEGCPKTAIVHLEALEQKCKQEGTWDALEEYLGHCDGQMATTPSVASLTSRTRDKMTAITQSFLHKALDIHRGGINTFSRSGYATPRDAFSFIMLPPSTILEYFLRSYVRSLSDYYPLIFGGCVDPNEMLHNNQASTLLVLLMIAQGAAAVPMAEARYLSAGLTETCRISLFDIIEKDVELSADPTILRCALLFTLLGSWSGDKWQMDIAMGQRGMYLSMLKHAGMLEPQPSMIPAFNNSTSTELQWRAWIHREAQNRLVYNWVMLDQELSLFHDSAPLLSISDLQCPLPSPELLWLSSTSEQWLAGVQSLYGCTANLNPQLLTTPSLTPSLSDLFQDFLHDNLSRRQDSITPQQLRLLLHPLQSLLCHLRQMLSCFSDLSAPRRTTTRTVTKASTLLRLEEVQALLQKWYELAMIYDKANPNCAVTRCNLVLYHLISLNAVTNFSEIERLARREGFDGSFWEISLRHKRCIYQREESIFHCGQIFRLLRLMPADQRPSWWSAALYRATLVLWTDSIIRMDPNFTVNQKDHASPGSSTPVAVDQVVPEDPAVIAYLWNSDGVAVLTRPSGSTVSLETPSDVLSLGISTMDGISTRFGDGIKRKLMTLTSNWGADAMGASSA